MVAKYLQFIFMRYTSMMVINCQDYVMMSGLMLTGMIWVIHSSMFCLTLL